MATNAWFRMYSEFATDPKVQSMSEAMQRRLAMLFCLRSSEALNTLKEDEIAFALRVSDEDLLETKNLFLKKGFIGEAWEILKWDKRQYISDSSTERTQRYRDKREERGLPRGTGKLSDPELYSRDGHTCIYCSSQEKLCIDHIYPIVLGGCDDYDNLGVACKFCNSGKSGRTPEQARYKIVNKQALARYKRYCDSRNLSVTVTVTAPDTDTDTDSEQKQSKPAPKSRGTRFSESKIPDEYLAYSKGKLGWSESRAMDVFEDFRLFWIAKAGKDGLKADWLATWQGWCRREKGGNGSQPSMFRHDVQQPQGPAYQPWVDKFAHLEVSK